MNLLQSKKATGARKFRRLFIPIFLAWLALVTLTLACLATFYNTGEPAATPAEPMSQVLAPTASQTPVPSPAPSATPSHTTQPSSSPSHTPSLTPTPTARFAVIGDYGLAGQAELDVANLIKSWQPDFIITTGDNNYPTGSWDTIDANIGQYYQEFIGSYSGEYGEGADQNRFFPSLGNHDWMTELAEPYLDYFSLPGNERYYEFTWGPVHLFALSADWNEPDGIRPDSPQAEWLREALSASTLPWKVVYMHLPPYSSGMHGSVEVMRWPYREWGATAVISGHDHTYERLSVDDFPYFVNGIGGGAIYNFEEVVPGSQARYNQDYGAMFVEADPERLRFQFVNRRGEVVDDYEIRASP